jgi:hypothetical protein
MTVQKGFRAPKQPTKNEELASKLSLLTQDLQGLADYMQQRVNQTEHILNVLTSHLAQDPQKEREQIVMDNPKNWIFTTGNLWLNLEENKFYLVTPYLDEFLIEGEAPKFKASNSIDDASYDLEAETAEEARTKLMEILKEKVMAKSTD